MAKFEILTLFPEIFASFLKEGLIGKAIQNQGITVNLCNYRQYGLGKHLHVDDLPYGGGPGMVLKVEPIYHALIESEQRYENEGQKVHKILITPQGSRFDQKKAKELSERPEALILICGRYEGFDERVRSLVDEELSGGDFICLGGETIAMTMVEAISRLIPGVIGNQLSLQDESFAQGGLEYPQYTRPVSFMEMTVPEILLSGNHQKIKEWRMEQSLQRTQERRPDLS